MLVPIAIGRDTSTLEVLKISEMAAVYILFSPKLDKFYTGSCLNLEERLLDHKNKKYSNAYTTLADDWELYFEINGLEYELSRKIELNIKSMKSKKYIEDLKKYPESAVKLINKLSQK